MGQGPEGWGDKEIERRKDAIPRRTFHTDVIILFLDLSRFIRGVSSSILFIDVVI
jgi:hypothetical protein